MSISSAGIGSGLDVASIVQQLVSADRAPAAGRIDRTERQVNAQISAIGSLRAALDGLRSAVAKLASDDAATARKVGLPAEPSFSASAASGAPIGHYQVEVLALASAHKVTSGAYADADAVIGTGTLTITSGDTTLEVAIDAGTNTLAGIRDAINAAAAGKGVTASIVTADDGAHLVLGASLSGTANAISVAASGGDGGLSALADANLTELAAAADAQVKVDGLLRTSASNTVSGMLQGVTLTLTKATPGTVQDLGISGDPAVLRGAAKGLVTAYNATLGAIARTTKYDPATKVAAALNGDALVRGVSRDLRGQLSAAVSDLATLGIRLDTDGTMTLDDAAFDAALAADPGPASRLFGKAGSLTGGLESTLAPLLDDDGLLDSRKAGLDRRTGSIADQRLALDRRMAQVEARYRQQFTALDGLMAQLQSTSTFLSQQLSNLPGL